jgi:hypothetical protein
MPSLNFLKSWRRSRHPRRPNINGPDVIFASRVDHVHDDGDGIKSDIRYYLTRDNNDGDARP